MKALRSSLGPIIRINGRFLAAFLFGFSAWAIWPEDAAAWWQFRVLSVMIALAGASALIGAFKEMGKLHQRDRAIAEMEAQGSKPKNSALASSGDLHRGGMQDG